jgi:hypothetical protein
VALNAGAIGEAFKVDNLENKSTEASLAWSTPLEIDGWYLEELGEEQLERYVHTCVFNCGMHRSSRHSARAAADLQGVKAGLKEKSIGLVAGIFLVDNPLWHLIRLLCFYLAPGTLKDWLAYGRKFFEFIHAHGFVKDEEKHIIEWLPSVHGSRNCVFWVPAQRASPRSALPPFCHVLLSVFSARARLPYAHLCPLRSSLSPLARCAAERG